MRDNKFTLDFTISGENMTEASRRQTALATLEKYIDTDVLEILAKKSGKPGVNDKVRNFHKFL